MHIEIKTVETTDRPANLYKAMRADGVPKGTILATLLKITADQHDAIEALRAQNNWLKDRNIASEVSLRNELFDRVLVMLRLISTDRYYWRQVFQAERKNATAEGRRPGQTMKHKKASPDYGRVVALFKLTESVIRGLIIDSHYRARKAIQSLAEIMPDFIAADEIAGELTRATDAFFGDNSPESTKWRRKIAECVHLPVIDAISEMRARLTAEAQSMDERRERDAKEYAAVFKAVSEAVDELATLLVTTDLSTITIDSDFVRGPFQATVEFAHPTVPDLRMELGIKSEFISVWKKQHVDRLTDLTAEKTRIELTDRICYVYSGGLTRSPSTGSWNTLQNSQLSVASASNESKSLVIPLTMLFSLSVFAEKRDITG